MVAARPVLPALAAVVVTASPVSVSAQTVPGDFAITLERTQGIGPSPVYSVRIGDLGSVTYEGTRNVRVEGRQADRVPASAVSALFATVGRIGFFELDDRYREIVNPDGTTTFVTDLPTAFVTVTTGGRSKRIEDYVGTPRELRDLERQIDGCDPRASRPSTAHAPAGTPRAGWRSCRATRPRRGSPTSTA